MAKIGVEIQQVIEVVVDCEPYRGQGRRSQAQLAGAVDHVHVRHGIAKLVGDLSGSIGRVVVDDQDRAWRSEQPDRSPPGASGFPPRCMLPGKRAASV